MLTAQGCGGAGLTVRASWGQEERESISAVQGQKSAPSRPVHTEGWAQLLQAVGLYHL